jgi:hemerythrin-like domain-containing protein
MSRPTHILRHEHRVIEQGLRALDGICFKLRTAEAVPIESLQNLLDFMQNFAIRFHHGKEEGHLFPALQQAGVRNEGGVLGFLCKEHELEQQLLAELALAIDGYRNGEGDAGDRFASAAIGFRDHLVGHMQQEDAVLFSLAEELLDEPVKAALIKVFATDREGCARYESMATELERAWAV